MNQVRDAPRNASIRKRLIASVIDLAICISLIVIPYIGLLVGPLYIVCRDGLHLDSLQGVSIGKSMMGLKVVSYVGGNDLYGIPDSLKRNFLLLLPVMLPVELYFILSDRDRRRLGDRIAGSWVVEIASNPWLELVHFIVHRASSLLQGSPRHTGQQSSFLPTLRQFT